MKNGMRSKILLKVLLVLGALLVFAASCLQQTQKLPVAITASETPEPIAVSVSQKTFESFSHNIPEHKQFECASCHRREGGVTDLEFAGHNSCVGCHLNQFTDRELMNKEKQMCSICHDDLRSNPPTMLKFPTRFIEGFNMKFSHADHDNGKGRPPEGCSSCHESAGRGMSIPVGLQAHMNCYTCHTAESKIGSCNVCHELAPYNRTSPGRYVFKAVFSHADHSARQGVSCNECHGIRPGASQGRQVTNIAAEQHNCGSVNNCNSCHNGSRAFSGNDFLNIASCARCHTGSGFNMIPGGPCRN